MEFDNKFPEWKNKGSEPSSTRKEKGFELGYKPPAGIFNWFWSLTSKAITELQTKFGNHADNKENPHKVTAEQIGLDKVDNTPDSEKSVNTASFASEAGVGGKVKYPMSVRFNGGSTEGTDLWTYDGSTGKSINITPEKIRAAKATHTHSINDVVETSEKRITRIVAATSTDGVAYTATVDGLTELQNGIEITIIPDINNSNKSPTLDINGLGAVKIYRPLSFATFVANAPEANFIRANTPCRLMYHANYVNGGIWLIAEKQKTSAQDLYGTVPIESGGTGAKTAIEAREALGAAAAITSFNPVIVTSMKNLGEGIYLVKYKVDDLYYLSGIFCYSLSDYDGYTAIASMCEPMSSGDLTVLFERAVLGYENSGDKFFITKYTEGNNYSFSTGISVEIQRLFNTQ